MPNSNESKAVDRKMKCLGENSSKEPKAEGNKFSLQSCFWKMNKKSKTKKEQIVVPNDRPQTSYVPNVVVPPKITPEKPKEVKNPRPRTSHVSKFVRSEDSTAEYMKKYANRVAFEKYPESIGDSIKSELPRPRTRRNFPPRFISNLEKIPEEPEDPLTKLNSELSSLKELVSTSMEGFKSNIEVSTKTLYQNIENLDRKMKYEYRREIEVLSQEKALEISNLAKKNEVLNISLKHKADENLKLKQQLQQLKSDMH